MMEQGPMTKQTGIASDLLQLTEQLNTLEPATVARAIQEIEVSGLPLTTQQAEELRNNNFVSTLVALLESPYFVTLRSNVLHIVTRMCRLDRVCQDCFINYDIVRKLIKNADPSQGNEVDTAAAAIRALACLAGGEVAGPSQVATVEDVFFSGLVDRMRLELAARCRAVEDPFVAAIGDFLATAAACPAHHVRIRDAAILPLLPILLESAAAAGGGGSPGVAFLDLVYHLSTSDAVAPSMRMESYFDALVGMLSAVPAMSPSRQKALLAICNVFGADADNVRAEEVLRVNGVPPLLTALLAAALGPADVGAAARTTGATPVANVGSAGGGLQRRHGSGNVIGMSGAGRGMRISDGGALARSRVSNNGGGTGLDSTATVTIAGGHQHHSETVTAGWQVRTSPSDSLSTAAPSGGRKNTGNGYALSSITAPGFGGSGGNAAGGGGAGSKRMQQPSTDVGSDASLPVPLEAVLHSIRCMAANPMHARKLAKPGSPAYVLPSLLDAVVSSLQHAAAGEISRAVCTARATAGAQTLLRLASCAELVPPLRAAGVPAVLRLLALEADDPRIGEAACGALLYIGDTGLVGYTSRPAAAAFRALYRSGTASASPESEFGNRFQVFVSHHRADAHQFALFTLHPMLVLQGVPIFVDPQHRTASSDWAHMISSCKNVVVVMSEMLLASPDHVREAEAAVMAGVNVVVVVPEGARWSDSQGNKTFDSPPPAVLLALPACIRGIFAENTLSYSAARHGEFTQQLMTRLQLPAASKVADGVAEAVVLPSVSPGREATRLCGGDTVGGGGGGSDASRGPSRGRGRWTGRGDTQAGDDQPPHRVSFTGVGDAFQRLQQQQEAEERAELARAVAASTGGAMGTGPVAGQPPAPPPPLDPLLPWPWSRLLDASITVGSDDEEEPVRYPRSLYGGCNGNGNAFGSVGGGLAGMGGGTEPLSGSALRESATGMTPYTAAPPAAGAPASYTSRRYMARQRSSINRHVALQLQQQHQQFLVQQQWLQEYQRQLLLHQQHQQQRLQQVQQHQASLLGSTFSGADEGPTSQVGAASVAAAATAAGAVGSLQCGGDATTASMSMLSELLALQLEMVRYELRQAVQASHDNIIYKIDRLRSDVTEQVVQLRFDLAGKIETLHEALSKVGISAGSGGTSPRELGEAASGGTTTTASSAVGGGSGGSNREAKSSIILGQQHHQQLAAALSNSLTASLQEAVNRAVAQLQATVAAAGTGVSMKAAPLQPPVPITGAPMSPSVVGGGAGANGILPKGHQGSVAVMAAAAAQQQQQQQQQVLQQQQSLQNSPHPPVLPSSHPRAGPAVGGGGGGATLAVLAPQTPHIPQGMEMFSPVARAGAAAWSGDGGVNTAGQIPGHGGGAKSRSSHQAVANGTHTEGKGLNGGSGFGNGGGGAMVSAAFAAATPPPTSSRPGPLSMFDAVLAEDEAGGGGGSMDGRVISPNQLVASVTSPATAQAAILMAGRGRHIPPSQSVNATAGGGGAGVSLKDRNGSSNGSGGASGIRTTSGKGTLPPLAGLLPSFLPSPAAKLAERTDGQTVRKAQQQQLLIQQQQGYHA